MVNYLQKKKSSTFVLMIFIKMPIICGPKYNRAVLLFLQVFTGVGS